MSPAYLESFYEALEAIGKARMEIIRTDPNESTSDMLNASYASLEAAEMEVRRSLNQGLLYVCDAWESFTEPDKAKITALVATASAKRIVKPSIRIEDQQSFESYEREF